MAGKRAELSGGCTATGGFHLSLSSMEPHQKPPCLLRPAAALQVWNPYFGPVCTFKVSCQPDQNQQAAAGDVTPAIQSMDP